jgi:hypothetical protein
VGDDAAAQPGRVHAVAQRLDGARDLAAGDGRQLREGERPHRDARAQAGVDEVHAGGRHGDPDLVVAWVGRAGLLEDEVPGGAERVKADGVHGRAC